MVQSCTQEVFKQSNEVITISSILKFQLFGLLFEGQIVFCLCLAHDDDDDDQGDKTGSYSYELRSRVTS